MHAENEPGLTPELFRTQLKAMADLDLSGRSMERFEILAGLVSVVNMLQPEGYSEAVPAVTFQPIKE